MVANTARRGNQWGFLLTLLMALLLLALVLFGVETLMRAQQLGFPKQDKIEFQSGNVGWSLSWKFAGANLCQYILKTDFEEYKTLQPCSFEGLSDAANEFTKQLLKLGDDLLDAVEQYLSGGASPPAP